MRCHHTFSYAINVYQSKLVSAARIQFDELKEVPTTGRSRLDPQYVVVGLQQKPAFQVDTI